MEVTPAVSSEVESPETGAGGLGDKMRKGQISRHPTAEGSWVVRPRPPFPDHTRHDTITRTTTMLQEHFSS